MTPTVDEIRELLKVAPRVLLVESEGERKVDQQVYQTWLDRLAGGAGTGRVPLVVASGSRESVIKKLAALRAEADAGFVYGLVDRDEWADATTSLSLANTPGLCVNVHRHCIESYFCVPEDLSAGLKNSGMPQCDLAARAIVKAVKDGLPGWVGHWALWTTLERLNARMKRAAYPNAFHQGVTLPSNAEIKSKLEEWAQLVSVDEVLRDFRALKKESLRRPRGEQVRSCIYAKNVFPQVIRDAILKTVRSEIEADEWMPELAKWMPSVPADIQAILEPMIAA